MKISTVLIYTISQYLAAHKRIVVPQLGTFIVKDPGRSILFSELLRRDDGVLRGLLCGNGVNELEAAGEIDRFVFEVRHAVEHGREYRMEGFGVLKPGPNGTIAFVYEPAAAERRQGAADAAERDGKTASGDSAVGNGGAEPAGDPRAALHPDRVAGAVKAAFAEPKVSPSVKMNPDPSVRGLRYGRPPKTTAAYKYVDTPPRRRTDRFIWIAVIAALIAVAAIAFGYYREMRERRAEAEYVELPVTQTLPAALREDPEGPVEKTETEPGSDTEEGAASEARGAEKITASAATETTGAEATTR